MNDLADLLEEMADELENFRSLAFAKRARAAAVFLRKEWKSKALNDVVNPALVRLIRDLTDKIVPDDPRPYMPASPDPDDFVADGIWIGRQEIRQRLLAEADRAEAWDD